MAAASSSLARSSSARAIESSRLSSLMSVRSSPAGGAEDCRDPRRRARRALLELGKPGAIWGLVTPAVVEVDEAEEPVAIQERQADRRLDLVAPYERAVDLGRGVPGDELLPRHGKPDSRAVMVDSELVRDLALAHVRGIAGQLFAHVGQGVEKALLGVAGGKGRVVGLARLFIEKHGDDVGFGGVLHVG